MKATIDWKESRSSAIRKGTPDISAMGRNGAEKRGLGKKRTKRKDAVLLVNHVIDVFPE